jgi:hypothetical protein
VSSASTQYLISTSPRKMEVRRKEGRKEVKAEIVK